MVYVPLVEEDDLFLAADSDLDCQRVVDAFRATWEQIPTQAGAATRYHRL